MLRGKMITAFGNPGWVTVILSVYIPESKSADLFGHLLQIKSGLIK